MCTSQCYSKYINEKKKECLNTCPIGYYYSDSPVKECYELKCPSTLYNILGTFECVTQCSNNQYIFEDNKECRADCNSSGLYYGVKDKTCVSSCSVLTGCDTDNHCYDTCPINTFNDAALKTCCPHCINNKFKNIRDNTCVTDCKAEGLYIYQDSCVEECPNPTIINHIKIKCISLSQFETDYDNYLNDLGNSLDILIPDYTLRITSDYFFQLNNTTNEGIDEAHSIAKNLNIPKLNLSECERKIKEEEHIPLDEPLIIAKYDYKTKPINPSYEFYTAQGVKLDKKICDDISISISQPFPDIDSDKFAEGEYYSKFEIDIYNRSNAFFTEICFKYTPKNGLDIPLSMRGDLFKDPSPYCNDNCKYNGISYETKTIDCECSNRFKNNPVSNQNTIPNTDFKQSFFDVYSCASLIWNMDTLTNNYGTWISFVIFLIQIASIAFIICGSANSLMNFLSRIHDKAYINQQKKGLTELKSRSTLPLPNPNHRNKQIQLHNQFTNDLNSNDKLVFNKNIAVEGPIIAVSKDNINKQDSKVSFTQIKVTSIKDNEIIKEVEEEGKQRRLNKNQLNKSYGQCYIESLMVNQSILYAFFYKSVTKVKSLRISLFVFNLSLLFSFNVLFYTENEVKSTFQNEGAFIILNHLNSIFFSGLGAYIIGMVFDLVCLGNCGIKSIENQLTPKQILEQSRKLIRIHRIKIAISSIIQIIMILGLAYLSIVFCSVYKNNQANLLFAYLISVGIKMVFPFLSCLILSLIQYVSFKCNNQCCLKIISILH